MLLLLFPQFQTATLAWEVVLQTWKPLATLFPELCGKELADPIVELLGEVGAKCFYARLQLRQGTDA